MAESRKQFTFYASYWDAMQGLKPTQRAAAYDAIIQYALFETPPSLKDPVVRMAFTLIKPTLDKGRAKALSGKTGGSKPEANDGSASPDGTSEPKAKRKQTESKREANGKQTESEKEGEREIEVEVERELELELERELELELEIENNNSGNNQEDSTPTDRSQITIPAVRPDDFDRFWKAWAMISQKGREAAEAAWRELILTEEDAERAIFRVPQYWCSLLSGSAKRVDAATWLRKGAWK